VAVFGVVASAPVGLFAGAFLVGGTSLFVAPSLLSRLIGVAPGAQLMGAALNQSATNVANSIGADLGGLVIAWGRGYLAPAWVGVGLGLIGLALAALSFRLEARLTRPVATRPEPAPAVVFSAPSAPTSADD
jgi:DHA1 family inner membrane transport protein